MPFYFLAIEAFDVIIIILVGIAILAILDYYFSPERKFRSMTEVKDTPIQKAQENQYVKITGKALNISKPIIAPISGRQCIAYQVHLETYDDGWNTLVKETVTRDFFINKNGEMALVKTKHLYSNDQVVYLIKDKKTKSSFLNGVSPRLEKYLAKHGESSTNFLGLNKGIRCQEGVISIGENVAVQGIAKWETPDEPITGFNYSKILTLNGSKKEKLRITDLKDAVNPKTT